MSNQTEVRIPGPGTSDRDVRSAPESNPVSDWMLAAKTGIPVLPELATRVIALAADPDTTIAQLARVVSKDQVLATRLLGLANSAFSAVAVEVTTIPEAIMRVGASGVRNLAVTVCFASRMHDKRVYGEQGRLLVDHGVGTAYLAHLIGQAAGEDPDEAFLCGLLHDIGKLVILKWYHESARRTGGAIDQSEIAEVMRRWHPAVAGAAFRRWNMPPALEEPVTCHHHYTRATGSRRLAAVVYLANRLSHHYGFGCEAEPYDVVADPAFAELGLDAGVLAEIDGKAPGLFAVARQALA